MHYCNTFLRYQNTLYLQIYENDTVHQLYNIENLDLYY